jgi:hypothetical protein
MFICPPFFKKIQVIDFGYTTLVFKFILQIKELVIY